jgi:hypothetical protein
VGDEEARALGGRCVHWLCEPLLGDALRAEEPHARVVGVQTPPQADRARARDADIEHGVGVAHVFGPGLVVVPDRARADGQPVLSCSLLAHRADRDAVVGIVIVDDQQLGRTDLHEPGGRRAVCATKDRDSILGRYSIDEDGHTTTKAYGRLAVVDGALAWDEP